MGPPRASIRHRRGWARSSRRKPDGWEMCLRPVPIQNVVGSSPPEVRPFTQCVFQRVAVPNPAGEPGLVTQHGSRHDNSPYVFRLILSSSSPALPAGPRIRVQQVMRTGADAPTRTRRAHTHLYFVPSTSNTRPQAWPRYLSAVETARQHSTYVNLFGRLPLHTSLQS